MLVRSCQALSAADLALALDDESPETGGLGNRAAESGGAGATAGAAAALGNVSFLSGGAEGDMTAAIRMLHELGPSAAGRCAPTGNITIGPWAYQLILSWTIFIPALGSRWVGPGQRFKRNKSAACACVGGGGRVHS